MRCSCCRWRVSFWQRDLFSGQCPICCKIAGAMPGLDRETIARTAVRSYAAAYLNRGLSPESAESRLIANGVSPQVAAGVIKNVMADRAPYQLAAELLDGGSPLGEVRRKLVENGLDVGQAVAVIEAVQQQRSGDVPEGEAVQRPVLAFLGMVVFGAGILLFIGNRTGLFATFPFAGFITMGIGGALFGASWTRRKPPEPGAAADRPRD